MQLNIFNNAFNDVIRLFKSMIMKYIGKNHLYYFRNHMILQMIKKHELCCIIFLVTFFETEKSCKIRGPSALSGENFPTTLYRKNK